MSIKSVMPSNYLILSSPSPSAFSLSQHQGLFLCLLPVFPTPVTSPSAPCSPVPGPSPGRLPLVDLSSPVTQSKTRISKNPYPGLSHRRHVYQRSTRTGPWHRRTRSRRGGGRSQDTKHRDHPQMDGCLLLVIFPKITDIQGWCVCHVSQHRPLLLPSARKGPVLGCVDLISLLHLDVFHKDQ